MPCTVYPYDATGPIYGVSTDFQIIPNVLANGATYGSFVGPVVQNAFLVYVVAPPFGTNGIFNVGVQLTLTEQPLISGGNIPLQATLGTPTVNSMLLSCHDPEGYSFFRNLATVNCTIQARNAQNATINVLASDFTVVSYPSMTFSPIVVDYSPASNGSLLYFTFVVHYQPSSVNVQVLLAFGPNTGMAITYGNFTFYTTCAFTTNTLQWANGTMVPLPLSLPATQGGQLLSFRIIIRPPSFVSSQLAVFVGAGTPYPIPQLLATVTSVTTFNASNSEYLVQFSVPVGGGANLTLVAQLDSLFCAASLDTLSYPPPVIYNGTLRTDKNGLAPSSHIVYSNKTTGENVYFGGAFFSGPSLARVKYSNVNGSTYPCLIVPSDTNDNQIACTTHSGTGTGYTFMVQVVNQYAYGYDIYNYPVAPQIMKVTGCPQQSADGNQALGCPTQGGTILTMYGTTFSASTTFTVNGVTCSNPQLPQNTSTLVSYGGSICVCSIILFFIFVFVVIIVCSPFCYYQLVLICVANHEHGD